jgi:hypothetical protein
MFKIKCLQFKLLSLLAVLLFSAVLWCGTANAADSSVIEGWNYNGSGGSYTGLFFGINGSMSYSSFIYPGKWGTPTTDYAFHPENYDQTTKHSLASSTNTTLNSGFSLCTWAKDPSPGSADMGIWLFDSSGNEKLNYNFRSNNAGHLYISGQGFTITSGSFPSLISGSWGHYCIVASGNVGTVYKDGAVVTTVSISGSTNYNNIYQWYIKRTNGNVDYDDLIIFNRPLNSTEVNTLRTNQLTSSFAFTSCGDGICNGTENQTTCSVDCPPINNYTDVIHPITSPITQPLIPDTNVIFYYNYRTDLITNDSIGAMAYIKLDRCLDVGCSTSTPVLFTDGTGATSTTSFILSGSTSYASSSSQFGYSQYTIINPVDRLGNGTTTEEMYKITPYYLNRTLDLIKANSAVQIVDWLSYADQYPCIDKPFDPTGLCHGMEVDDLLGQISCGGKYAITVSMYTLFNPSCSSLNYIQNGFSLLKKGFPFNAYFDLTDSINTAIENSKTATTTAIGIPFIDIHSTSTNKYVILPLISSSSVSNAIGSDNKNLFRTSLGYLIWILTAAIVFFIITKI